MATDLLSEVWNELKQYINTVDRQEAAEVLVSVLVDNDIDPADIRVNFKGDNDVKAAVAAYIKDHDSEAEEQLEEEEEEYDDEDDEYEN
jgi:hypothetical protein